MMNSDLTENFAEQQPFVQSFSGPLTQLEHVFKEIESRLISRGETVSTAESVTAGFLQFSFSQMKDASKFFEGGMTVYTLKEKVKLLKVDQDEASQCDCVSAHIAETMAINVAKLYDTDWSIAVTGYANPVEESQGNLFAFYSISYQGNIIVSERIDLAIDTQSIDAQVAYTHSIFERFELQLNR
ncbi:CinA family protein [Chryseobacterium sp. 09-1422]|uniref:CinA family protein n=1 Tax=Chryseobacterium kimseyorum TaxID=2984028 RepID=A0ABT3I3J9_9FLAO|nr:CinA family protein [Chryseobacterium kimseyorum]MCW3170644.1 CinA family protein [Chryseobacterium kimseyorum]